jgi:site-specific DNA recombinase
MKVVGYIRCSTENSEDSPQVQQASIEHYCDREKHELVKCYIDYGVSGGLPLLDRPEAGRMLAEAPGLGIRGIVALRLERFSRNLHDLIGFVDTTARHKLRLMFATEEYADDATGRLTLQIIGAIAEYYRTLGGQRIKESHTHKVKAGRFVTGRAAYGYNYNKDTKKLEVNESEAEVVRACFDLFIKNSGRLIPTYRELNALGYHTRKGHEWDASNVARLINNVTHTRCLKFNELVVYAPETIPEIVPLETVTQARSLAQRRSTPRGYREPYALQRLVTCVCGKKYMKNGHSYICGMRFSYECTEPGIGLRKMHNLVIAGLEHILQRIKDEIPRSKPKKRKSAVVSVVEIERKKQAIVEMRMDGLLSREQARAKFQELELLAVPEVVEESVEPPRAVLDIVIKEFRQHWESMTEMERRELVLRLTTSIQLVNNKEKSAMTIESPYVPYPVRVCCTTADNVWVE